MAVPGAPPTCSHRSFGLPPPLSQRGRVQFLDPAARVSKKVFLVGFTGLVQATDTSKKWGKCSKKKKKDLKATESYKVHEDSKGQDPERNGSRRWAPRAARPSRGDPRRGGPALRTGPGPGIPRLGHAEPGCLGVLLLGDTTAPP